MTDEKTNAEPSAPSRGSVANLDAVPAAIAPVDRLVRLGATDRESVGTDKAEPLTRDCGTGNTLDRPKPIKQPDFDRPKPISDARLAALEELSALDQKLELEYGLTGNPMIKAQQRTPDAQTTPAECSVPPEWTSRPYWVDPPSGWAYGFPRLYDPAKDGDMTEWLIANGYPERLARQGLPCTFTACTEDGGM